MIIYFVCLCVCVCPCPVGSTHAFNLLSRVFRIISHRILSDGVLFAINFFESDGCIGID